VADYNDILAALHEHHPEIARVLAVDQLAALDAARSTLAQRSMEIKGDADAEARLTADVLSLLATYPSVEGILRKCSPDVLPPLPKAPVAVPQIRPLPQSSAPRRPADDGSASTRDATGTNVTVPEQNAPQSSQISATTGATDAAWTPDLRMQAFKEVVTPLIGLILVSFTVYFAVRTVDVAGDAAKASGTQQVLTLMLGLAGVVIGYYFGRVPADAQAAQARREAHVAVAGAEAISSRAESLAAEIDQLDGTAVTRGGGPSADQLEVIRRKRNELRSAVNNLARR
jgi:hypothetical protein